MKIPMLRPSNLEPYQRRAVIHQIQNPRSFLWLFMGSGKTIITLTTVAHLLKEGAVNGALICAPLRVAQGVWHKESLKWAHTKGLRFSFILGTPRERIAAIFADADIYLINYEQLPWLALQLQYYFVRKRHPFPFQMLVLDESSKMKNSTCKRVVAMRTVVDRFPWRTGLTGTPATNGLIDLHGQFLMVDDGRRLGPDLTTYKANYFTSEGYGGYKFTCSEEKAKIIHHAVSDIVLEMKEEDYIKLPDMLVMDVPVTLPPKVRRIYDELETQLFTELDSGTDLEIHNEASKINKLLQISNGAVFTNTEARTWESVHDAKIDALGDIIEEASGRPILVGYVFKPDMEKIIKKFPFAVSLSGLNRTDFNQAISDFEDGKIKLLIGHPASMGHGTDGLQYGGSIIVRFGLPWSLDLYLQLNKRLHRRGQGEPVKIYRILGEDTADHLVRLSLEHKSNTQDTLRAAVAEYRKMRGL